MRGLRARAELCPLSAWARGLGGLHRRACAQGRPRAGRAAGRRSQAPDPVESLRKSQKSTLTPSIFVVLQNQQTCPPSLGGDMLPFTTLTKVGPGDKTKAYVVRQNVCLKILLFSLIGVCVLLMVLASTMYDVHIERRMKARETGVHRREEHHLRLQVGRLGMRLQQQMRDEVRDMSILREYRARMYRAVGEYQNAVRSTVDEATAQNATLRTQLTKLELELDEQLEMAMRQLWSDVNAEGKRAGEKLHNLTAEIIQDLKLDQVRSRFAPRRTCAPAA